MFAISISKWKSLASRVWTDPSFRDRLVSAPQDGLAELGIATSPNVSIRLVPAAQLGNICNGTEILLPFPPARERVTDGDILSSAGIIRGASRLTFGGCTECCKTQRTANYCCKG